MKSHAKAWLNIAAVSAICLAVPSRADDPQQNWTHFVRIGAYGLSSSNSEKIVRDATTTHVFGIEVDNDIPGRYESFLDPAEKLKERPWH